MYDALIFRHNWMECSMYLEQNYFRPNEDYTVSMSHNTVIISFVHRQQYEQFVYRWSSIIINH